MVRASARAAAWLGGGTTDLSADCLHTLERLMLAQAAPTPALQPYPPNRGSPARPASNRVPS